MYECESCGTTSEEPKECCGAPMKMIEDKCPNCGKPMSQCTCGQE